MQFNDQLQQIRTDHSIRCLWVVGANTFQEAEPLTQLCPHLTNIYLFEPIPELFKWLKESNVRDSRIKVYQCALSNFNGVADFFVTNNLDSSSLLPLGKHLEIFPHVLQTATIPVAVRTVMDLIKNDLLEPPDFLFMDAQGAELSILRALSSELLRRIRIIYTEASLEELYVNSGTLDDLRKILSGYFVFRGFAAFPNCPVHGNALFVNKIISRE
jgi:FkbM family methyltransferase